MIITDSNVYIGFIIVNVWWFEVHVECRELWWFFCYLQPQASRWILVMGYIIGGAGFMLMGPAPYLPIDK